MRNLIAGLSLAFALAVAAPTASAATVVFQQSGTHQQGSPFPAFAGALPGSGTYKFEITASVPVLFDLVGGYEDHWDVYFAPPPRPHNDFIEGNSFPVEELETGVASYASWNFVVPETTRTFFEADAFYEMLYGIPVGTPLYEENHAYDPWFRVYAEDLLGGDFSYDFKITLMSSAPEPATWAMMILGFGAVGSMARSSRRRARAGVA